MDAIDALAAHLARREHQEAGQQSKLAKHLEVSPGFVWQWLNRKRPIPPIHARGIEEYCRADPAAFMELPVTAYMVAPKVFGNPIEQQQRRQAAAE